MDQDSLVTDQVEAGSEFLEEFEKSTRIVVAFWLEEREEGRWRLYVASDWVDEGKLHAAYKEVLRVAKSINNSYFDPFRVTLLALREPMAQAALKIYETHSAKIPLRLRGRIFGGVDAEEVYLVRGPTGDYTMPSGREMLNQIIDQEAHFFEKHGKPPRKIKLPVLMAYDLAKCGRNEVGDLSGRVFMEGITAFEKEGFHGMSVEIIRDRNATLEFE